MDELHVIVPVADNTAQVFADGEETDGFQVWQHIVQHNPWLLPGREGVIEKHLHLLFLKLLNRYQHRWCVEQHLDSLYVCGCQTGGLEGLT